MTCLSEEGNGEEVCFPLILSLPHSLASEPSVLSHAAVPQEAALHESQRSGKKKEPLILSFTSNQKRQAMYQAKCIEDFCCNIFVGLLVRSAPNQLANSKSPEA